MNPPLTLLRCLVAAVVCLAGWSLAPAAGSAEVTARGSVGAGCRVTATEPERIRGTLAARPGRTVRRVHPAGAFRSGTAAARFELPRSSARLTVAVGSRRFRAALVRTPGRGLRLEIQRGDRTLTSRSLALRGPAARSVRVKIGFRGTTVRAKAWAAGRRQPGWQLSARHEAAARSGRASVSAALRGGERVGVRFSHVTVRVTRRHGSIGVYNGMFESGRTRQQLGRYPAVETSYYQPHQAVSIRNERTRIRRGISPNITITTKGTNLIEVLGTGRRHPGFGRAKAWLDRYVRGLARIAAIDTDVPVYATIEHEFKYKVRIRQVTGRSADPRYYGRTLRRFYAAARKASPHLRVTYWMVADGSDRALEEAAAAPFRTPPDAILFDPYADRGESLASITSGDIAWIKRQRWYVGQEIALGEFGMRVVAGDAELARFYRSAHGAIRDAGLSWGVFFNRGRDLDTQITDRSDGRRFPRAVAAFRAALAGSARC
ncbi:hypothetical protein [Nocardioides sp. TF02-7]|uniref:hypothetical protein n=1 Tax=Nocardioides sp. TF02-7 TaxID=2917724 RepID=UPI001F05B1B8|nr:hypothetical protein [Nocardioides sp. TF02-7]UMG91352.1 hypothetical protein MF408_14430 [Nocardioides sp. TF02-7]